MFKRTVASCVVLAAAVAGGTGIAAETKNSVLEAYVHEPMPSIVQVVGTEMDGPVFADSRGHTLYVFGGGRDRGGYGGGGDPKDKSNCHTTVDKVTTGNMAPWPAGMELPDLATRKSCAEVWPPLYAADDAKPVGNWSIITRDDGKKQWAFDHKAVYTSTLDQRQGDVNGGGYLHAQGASGTVRTPISPREDLPAQFDVESMPTGRMLTLVDGFSVYTWDKDGPNKSNCDGACLAQWKPVLAAATAPQVHGDWAIIARSPGVFQWTYRKKPLYALNGDQQKRSFHGADIPGWHNVYTTPGPAFPKGFTVQRNPGGDVLADASGKTIYIFNCIEDAADQQACDHPTTTQQYRWAICGGFDVKKCNADFPYVVADKNAKSTSQIWGVKDVDPTTGRYVDPGTPGSVHVWTFRDRPLYTFARDTAPGDVRANAWGEGNGWRNGFHAFWVREEFRRQF
ncbi:MAG: hypothetical protein K1X51_00120 [Rhodospirillaceae bacterium]|nr:hypothetical protein [Rhodospirillaceae bacterium]